MPFDEDLLLSRVERRAPFEDPVHARRVLEATLHALRDILEDDEAQWLASELGSFGIDLLGHARRPAAPTLDALEQRVALYSGVRRSRAQEEVRVVCAVLAQTLPEGTVQRLAKHLPALAVLFALPEPEPPVEGAYSLRNEVGPDHTLAGGRAGGSRPLYEARPADAANVPGTHHAHTHSVAVSDDPHGDSKLSSSHGLSQERAARSLANARPPAHKP